MNKVYLSILVIIIAGVSCAKSNEEIKAPTLFSAQISVPDSLDDTGNFAGFHFLLYSRETPGAAADTMFYAETDSNGFLSGLIEPEQAGVFPLQVSRNGVNIGMVRLIVSHSDTISITGEIPNNFTVDSRENRAMERYERVRSGYDRTNRFILAGQVPDSLIGREYQKWADLYWEVFNRNKGSLAAKFALEGTVDILRRIDQPLMFSRLNQAFDEDLAYGLAATFGKQYVANTKGLDASVAYLDSVRSLTKEKDVHKAIDQSIIKLHFDSANVDIASELLAKYERKYIKKDEEPSFWYKNIRYEISNFAPGMGLPDFSFVTAAGDSVNKSGLLGTVYVLEFSRLANSLYQSQYDESTVIYQIYNPQGLEYFTIPFDESVNTIIGFFQERNRFWALADPPSFDAQGIVDDFNVQYFPTRILVDQNGNIVRKFVGEEFEQIIPAITQTLSNN
ncbi:MAG: hypothetical protein ED557_14185 [Balneola sp.]|nr:MAG: hypothetical protein ED557_14185 [Balneola sp.]